MIINNIYIIYRFITFNRFTNFSNFIINFINKNFLIKINFFLIVILKIIKLRNWIIRLMILSKLLRIIYIDVISKLIDNFNKFFRLFRN